MERVRPARPALRDVIGRALRRALRPPYETPLVVVVNAVRTLAVITVLPGVLLVGAHRSRLTRSHWRRPLALGVLVNVGTSLVMWLGGLWGSGRLAKRNRDMLAGYLAEPSRG